MSQKNDFAVVEKPSKCKTQGFTEPLDDDADFDVIVNSRASMYGFLARLLRTEVDESLLSCMRTVDFPLDTGNPSIDEGYRLLKVYLTSHAAPLESMLSELAADFNHVFATLSVTGGDGVVPYESTYADGPEACRESVRHTFQLAGISKSPDWKGEEDHVALEIEFMQILSLRAFDALHADDTDKADDLLESQQEFLEEHLVNWVPLFVDEALARTRTDFYRGILCLTVAFIKADQEFLEDWAD
jgi:TorA maturation chaperone TorD